jgi:hypothetical protein
VDPKRLSAGEWVAAGGAVLLLVALFLPWYGAGSADATGWESLTVVDILLALLAAGALVATAVTARGHGDAVPVAFTVLTGLAGLVALLLVAWRVIDPTPAGDVSREVGAWLALIGAAGMAVGGWFGMSDEGPARRSDSAAEAAAAAALERTELLSITPDVGERA